MRLPIPATLVALLLFSSTGLASAGDAPRVVHVFTWHDYFSTEAIRLFEERHGCRVNFEYYDSNETMLEYLSHGGGFDVVTPPGSGASLLARQGMIRPLDHSLLPNLVHIDTDSSALSEDPKMLFAVPYTVTVTGIGYNRRQVPEDAVGSWAILGDARLAGKVTMLNDLRETIGAALKYLGHDINSIAEEEVRAAGEVLIGWKRAIAVFDVDGAKAGLAEGKYWAIQAYNGDMAHLMRENPDIGFFVPEEGSAINSDSLAICSDAESPDLAHAFINHFLDPDIAALNMDVIDYYMPNQAALEKMADFLRDNPAFSVPAAILAKCQVIRYLTKGQELYDDVWTDVLIGE